MSDFCGAIVSHETDSPVSVIVQLRVAPLVHRHVSLEAPADRPTIRHPILIEARITISRGIFVTVEGIPPLTLPKINKRVATPIIRQIARTIEIAVIVIFPPYSSSTATQERRGRMIVARIKRVAVDLP